jgi:hypothetical protein
MSGHHKLCLFSSRRTHKSGFHAQPTHSNEINTVAKPGLLRRIVCVGCYYMPQLQN